jgi:predicted adenine nucleotide alpha hydrolase (AANH) superfamily ATPase
MDHRPAGRTVPIKLLLHICCGPCTIYPLRILREMGHDLTGHYFNPNIHPYLEYKHRAETLRAYAVEKNLPVIWAVDYDMESFFRVIVDHEDDRCRLCYTLRLQETARVAKAGGFAGFTTTLLYSKFQKHDLIREVGERLGSEVDIPFVYHDFRVGWQEGVNLSRELGMYRQTYCGCVYSEKDRYYPRGMKQK